MVQILTKDCNSGECDHAPYPHKIVENELTQRQIIAPRRSVSTRIGVIQHVVCLACGHWATSRANCNCRYDCHNAGIKASVTVLD